MKSYNGLYDRLISDANIVSAMLAAGKNKNKKNRRHQRLRFYRQHAWDFISKGKELIENYQTIKHEPKVIYDGISAKKRTIIVPTVEEEIVHHAIVNVLKPVFMHRMYEHSYASIPGRGIHSAVRSIKRWITRDPEQTRYCLKLDIRKFFDSVDQEVLLTFLKRRIRDRRFTALLELVLASTEQGIPLGFVTSQWFANFLLTDLDHKVKEEWKAAYYIRFMDDMVIFGSTKEELHQIKTAIEDYLNRVLHLEVKSNWQVFLLKDSRQADRGRFLDFLGFKFYRQHLSLRRKLALKMQRKAQHIHKKDRANIRDARQMVTYGGYARYADCYEWFYRRISLYISITGLQKKISRYDKLNGGNACVA